jgi:hypothetical protein
VDLSPAPDVLALDLSENASRRNNRAKNNSQHFSVTALLFFDGKISNGAYIVVGSSVWSYCLLIVPTMSGAYLLSWSPPYMIETVLANIGSSGKVGGKSRLPA